jgi:acetylornithine/N-succinyldiaminopimelate aminotransferase
VAGDHGTTFGAGPLVATAALATLDVLDDDALHARVRVLGDRLRAGLERLRGEGRLADVRARGLMVGVDLPSERSGQAPQIVREALDERIVLNATGPDTVRFLPPLIIEEQHVDRVLEFMERAL